MRARHLLTVADLSAAQIARLFRSAAVGKRHRAFGRTALAGRSLALVFQKPSVRTRVSFEVAIRQLGGSSIYLGPDDAQLDTREPVRDVARTMSRYVDGIVARTFAHAQVEEFARYARVPVINGLSDLHHPCQALADLFTIQERFGRLRGLTIAYIGDGNNVLHSLVECAVRLGVRVRCAIPGGYRPDVEIWRRAAGLAGAAKAGLLLQDDPEEAVRGADVVYTDVWTSMGQEREREARRKAFRGFQVSARLLRGATPGCVVMHCLPAHRGEEIADDVLEGRRSIVFDQAENRLHVQKALLVLLMTGKGRG